MLPGVIENSLENAFGESLYKPKKLTVEVGAFPAAKMLLGKIDNIHIRADGLKYESFFIDEAEFNFKNFTFNPLEVIMGNYQLSLNQPGSARFTVSEKSLNDYLNLQGIPGTEDLNIKLLNDKIILESNIKFMGAIIPVTISGYFQVKQGTIFFKASEVNLGKYDFGDVFEERLKGNLNINFTFDFLPVKMKVTALNLDKGHLILETRILAKENYKK